MAGINIVDNTDGTLTITVPPGGLDGPGGETSNSDLRIYGVGTMLWGEGINENILRVAENWACEEKSASPGTPQDSTDLGPGFGVNNPLEGQLWYNKSNEKVYFWNGTSWKLVGAINPALPSYGDLTFVAGSGPCGNDQLEVYNGSSWVSVALHYLPLCGGTITGTLTIDGTGSLDTTGPVNVNGTLTTSGSTVNLNSASINTDVGSTLTVNGPLVTNSTLTVNGPISTFNTITTDATSTLTANGIVTTNNTLNANGGIVIPYGQEITLLTGPATNDNGAIYKYEPAVDQSHTRIRLSDNIQSSDLLDIGWEDGTWNSSCQISTDGNILTIGGITTNDVSEFNANVTLTNGASLLLDHQPTLLNEPVTLQYGNNNYLRTDGTGSMSGGLSMNGNQIFDVGTPTSGTSGMSRNYADGRYLNASGGDTGSGSYQFYSTDNSGNYSTSGIVIREVNLVTNTQLADQYAPALAFHWGTQQQAQIALTTDGHIHFRDGVSHATDTPIETGGHTCHGNVRISGDVLLTTPNQQVQVSTLLPTNNYHLATKYYVDQQIGSSSRIDVQVFTTSGTWTRPSTGSYVIIECWGGGGGGGRLSGNNGGGGGGGAYNRQIYLRSALSASESVIIGAGGAGRTSNGNGGAGGTTSFGGTICVAYGGGGGSGNSGSGCAGGGGGGMLGSGGNASGLTAGTSGDGQSVISRGGSGGTPSFLDGDGGRSHAGGGGGGGNGDNSGNIGGLGGDSAFGGGGGAASSYGTSAASAGGLSVYAGNGGVGGHNSTAGGAGGFPSGGGGGGQNGNSGAGNSGMVIVRTFI
jgi:hypothetical protein